jgi:hypothetical protein
MPKHLLLGTALLFALGLFGCLPDTLDEEDDYNVVITARKPGKDFEYKTFAMPEQVVDLSSAIDDGSGSDDTIEIDHSFDSTILDAVAAQMAEAGYDRVVDQDGSVADVQVVVGAVASNNWSWYGYYPWYGYGGDYYYWYYPPVAVPVNTPTGSVVVLMIDRKASAANDAGMRLAPVVWAGMVRGLLDSSSKANANKAVNLIDQMFEQAPYLVVGPPLDPEPGLGGDGGLPDLGDEEDGGAP